MQCTDNITSFNLFIDNIVQKNYNYLVSVHFLLLQYQDKNLLGLLGLTVSRYDTHYYFLLTINVRLFIFLITMFIYNHDELTSNNINKIICLKKKSY